MSWSSGRLGSRLFCKIWRVIFWSEDSTASYVNCYATDASFLGVCLLSTHQTSSNRAVQSFSVLSLASTFICFAHTGAEAIFPVFTPAFLSSCFAPIAYSLSFYSFCLGLSKILSCFRHLRISRFFPCALGCLSTHFCCWLWLSMSLWSYFQYSTQPFTAFCRLIRSFFFVNCLFSFPKAFSLGSSNLFCFALERLLFKNSSGLNTSRLKLKYHFTCPLLPINFLFHSLFYYLAGHYSFEEDACQDFSKTMSS